MAEDIAVKVAEVDSRSKSNTHRIDKMEKRQDNLDKLVTSVASLATEQEHIKKGVSKIESSVKTLTEKPAKRWDGLVEKVVLMVAVAFVAFLLRQVGL